MKKKRGNGAPTTLEWLFDQCSPEPNGGCWLWTRSVCMSGYGRVQVAGKLQGAHRAASSLANGAIPDGLQLDHLCRVRCCINPDHLELVTAAENTRRGIGVGAAMVARQKSKTHCPIGHPYSEENTRIHRGGRRCMECDRRKARERYIAKQGGVVGIPYADRTHCPQGHPYAGENLFQGVGYRTCRTCGRDRARIRYQINARKKAA